MNLKTVLQQNNVEKNQSFQLISHFPQEIGLFTKILFGLRSMLILARIRWEQNYASTKDG